MNPAPPEDPRAPWLALQRIPLLGATRLRRALEAGHGAHSLLHAGHSELLRLGFPQAVADALAEPDWVGVSRDLQWLEGEHRHLLTIDQPVYPPRLRELADAPCALFVAGDPEVLSLPQLAMVGSRNPTATGAETAHAFARALAAAGLVITSGLALGIDGQCHRGALAVDGVTVAALGCGLDRVYPERHRALAGEIARAGALVSEFPTGTPPLAKHFPRRNRVISGLSLGVLVVEAAVRSGSLITARLALEQGREVFAVPGSIHNPLARGCHALIRDGAKLVETATDVLEEVGAQGLVAAAAAAPSAPDATDDEGLDGDYLRLLECLEFEPTPVDLLVERSGLTPDAVSSMLLILELRGYVSAASGGLYSRAVPRG